MDEPKRPESQPPEQLSTRPGKQSEMKQQPHSYHPGQIGTGKLKGKVALITGGDSGIGRAVAIAFAKEGADIAIAFLNEDEDAAETKTMVEAEGVRCIAVAGDVGDKQYCDSLVQAVTNEFGQLDILVNNAAEQHPQDDITKISEEQLVRTFRTNIFSMFFLTQAALPHLGEGSTIINTASVTAYKGNPVLIDYTSTKGAIVAFTRALSQQLAQKGIRVNAVAPGPIWTRSSPRLSLLKRSKNLAKIHQWAARDSQKRWRLYSFSWPRTTPATSPDKISTSMVAQSSIRRRL